MRPPSVCGSLITQLGELVWSGEMNQFHWFQSFANKRVF